MTEVAKEMRAIRLRRKMRASEVSRKMGRHPGWWIKYETGERTPSLQMIAALSEVKGINLLDWEVVTLVRAAMEDGSGFHRSRPMTPVAEKGRAA